MAEFAAVRPSRARGGSRRPRRQNPCRRRRSVRESPVLGGRDPHTDLLRTIGRLGGSASTIVAMAVVVAVSYAIGSVPFALLLARRFGSADLRHVGSGNLGAANVVRASGVVVGV